MKNSIVSALTFSMVLLLGARTLAQLPTPAPTPLPLVTLNPEVIRDRVLTKNTSLYAQLLLLEDAKDKLTQDRSAFFPSISVGVSVPSFILKSVTALLPFLLPSTYFQLDQARDTFDADLAGFKVVELNTVATALSLYYTALADKNVTQIYTEEADNLNKIATFKQQVNQVFNYFPPEEVAAAIAAARSATYNANQMQLKFKTEIYNLKQSMGYSVDQEVDLADDVIAPLDAENLSIDALTAKALELAPEKTQIRKLVKAAESGALAAEFGIFTASLSGQVQGTGSSATASTSVFNMSGGATIGLGELGTANLSARNVDEIKLQDTLLDENEATLMASTLVGVHGYQDQANVAQQQLDAANTETIIYQNQYSQGIGSIFNVLLAHSDLTKAKINLVTAQMYLNLQRVTLQRALLAGEFGKIQGCQASPIKPGNFWDIFSSPDPKLRLDQICKEGGTNQPSKKKK
jgi:outer membrane protein TolC